MSNDADLIRKMMVAWYSDYGEEVPVEDAIKKFSQDMARVLAVVREHDATPARRVPVQIVQNVFGDEALAMIVLANDGTIHLGERLAGGFQWYEQLPSLPRPGGEA